MARAMTKKEVAKRTRLAKKARKSRARKCTHVPAVMTLIEHGAISTRGKWRHCPGCKLYYPPAAELKKK